MKKEKKQKKYIAPKIEVISEIELKDNILLEIGSGSTTPEESDAKRADFGDDKNPSFEMDNYSPWGD